MHCHVCNAEVHEGQKYCHECGESLTGVTDATQQFDVVGSFDDDAEEPAGGTQTTDAGADLDEAPLWATQPIKQSATDDSPPTADVPAAATADTSLAPPETAAPAPPAPPVDVLPPAASPPPLAEPAQAADLATTTMAAVDPAGVSTDEFGEVGTTDEFPAVYDGAGEVVAFASQPEGFRVRPTFVLAILAVVTSLMVVVADVTDVRTDRPVDGIDNQLRTLADIGSNLPIAGFIGAAVMMIGGLLHCFGLRWGAGLAGGAGLALAGWTAVTIGLAEVPISTAERITRDPSTPGPFTLTVTRDLGYWLVIALGALGVLVFVLSLTKFGSGGAPGLDPWSAAVGAVGGVIAAAGPMVTLGDADFSANFGTNSLPTMFFAGRITQVALLAAAAMIGFLSVRSFGLGLVAGGVTVPLWMWATSLVELGDTPIGIAVGNLGTTSIEPHAITTTGTAITLVMLIIAVILAVVQSRRYVASFSA